ncbi:MAG: FGGY-family carbohydrate kinase [Candidatus Thorarchaeota archaeon]
MTDRVFAVLDIGTTGTRAVLVNEEGVQLSKAYEEYPQTPRDLGVHEQLTETYWRTSCNTMQRAIADYESAAEAIIAVIVATPRDCITPVDKNGNPLAPTVTWVDNRSSPRSKDMAAEIGGRKSVNKIMWFIDQRPQIFEKAYKFVFIDAFIYNRLCGAMVSEPSNATFGPINHETLTWSEELCEATGIPLDKLTDIVAPGTVVGDVSSEAAKATGLRKGTIAIMGSGDQQCSALGTGTIESGIVKATTGTGTFVITHTDEYIEDPYIMFSHPSAIPGKWILEGVTPGTGLAFKWYRDQYCELEMKLAAQTGRNVYDLIESSASAVPAGSDGLVVFPFMAYNKGIIYNLGFSHTKAHLARAIMEANGYSIAFYLEVMEGILDLEFNELRIDGGGANSALWRQIQADCVDKPVVTPKVRDSAVIGAAILGTLGSGVYGSFDEAVSNMFHIEERREPIPENVSIYKKQYAIYNKLMNAELAELLMLTS